MFSHLERFPSPLFSPVSFPLFEKAFSPALPVFVVSENKRQNMYKQNLFFSRLVLSLFRESRFQQFFFVVFPSSSSNSKVYLHWGHGSAENGRFAVAFCVERCPWPPNPRSSFQLKKKIVLKRLSTRLAAEVAAGKSGIKSLGKGPWHFPTLVTCLFSSLVRKWANGYKTGILEFGFKCWNEVC